jgi:hypothetical protein
MDNCSIYDTRLAGIALEMVDGGILERVSINNIVIKNAGTAVFMRLGNRARPFRSKGPGGSRGTWQREPGLERPGIGSLRKVIISNLLAVGIGPVGCSITGLEDHPVEDVTLDNISIRFQGGGTQEMIHQEIPENEEKYPEYSMFGDLPSYGFYLRHARGIRFNNVKLEFQEPDKRPAFVIDDVQDLSLFHVDGTLDEKAPALMILKRTKDVLIEGCRPAQSMRVFARFEKSRDISVINNDFSKVEKIIEIKGKDSTGIFESFNREKR